MKSKGYQIALIRQRAKELKTALAEKQKAIDEFYCSDAFLYAASRAAILEAEAKANLAEIQAQRDELLQRYQVIADCPLMHGYDRAGIMQYLDYVQHERAEILRGRKAEAGTVAGLIHDYVEWQVQEAKSMMEKLQREWNGC